MKNKYDCLIIGSGLAGLTAALTLSKKLSVAVVSKSRLDISASSLAQGGIAAIVLKNDNVDTFVKDTVKAGDYYNDKKAVQLLAEKSRKVVSWLSHMGVSFATKNKQLQPSLEAAHSWPRIIHTSDFTGKDIIAALLSVVRKAKNLTLFTNTFVTDLLIRDGKCCGAFILKKNKKNVFFANSVILATGGAGQVYQWTTNPKTATGDGIAMALRAGAKLADMEFVQFHPTALKHGQSPLFLLSERLRGEGAYLIDKNDKRFVDELAPRDRLSRAIFYKQKTSEVYLTMTHIDKKIIIKKFPNIYNHLKKIGLDLTKEKIPITPAAHYLIGGVKTDLSGQTSIPGLYAVGECARTGVHGANRLASNSLLEAVVFGQQAAIKIMHQKNYLSADTAIMTSIKKNMSIRRLTSSDRRTLQSKNYALKVKLKSIMWQNMAIVRSKKKICKTLKELQQLQKNINNTRLDQRSWFELNNMIQVALEITKAAILRKKSLGAHYIV